MRILMLTLFLAAAGCSQGTPAPDVTVSDMEPAAVVASWLGAVSEADVAVVDGLVEPAGLAVIAAVENNLRSDELVGLLAEGMTPDLQTEYWSGFRESFMAIRGVALEDIVVGAEVGVPGLDDFVAVDVVIDGAAGAVITRRTQAGWRVDFAATIGPTLAGPLGDYLESALDGDNAAAIADAYLTAVVPGLEAAVAMGDSDSVLAFETEVIRQLANG